MTHIIAIVIVILIALIIYWYRYIYSGVSLIIYGQGIANDDQFTINIWRTAVPKRNIVGSIIKFTAGGQQCQEMILTPPVDSGSKWATFNTTNNSQLNPNSMMGIRAYIKYMNNQNSK
jgi:hypothetical protein